KEAVMRCHGGVRAPQKLHVHEVDGGRHRGAPKLLWQAHAMHLEIAEPIEDVRDAGRRPYGTLDEREPLAVELSLERRHLLAGKRSDERRRFAEDLAELSFPCCRFTGGPERRAAADQRAEVEP